MDILKSKENINYEREAENYVKGLLNQCLIMLEEHRNTLVKKLEQEEAKKLLIELAEERDTTNYDYLKKYCIFNQYICESFKRLKIEVIPAKELEKYTDASIFATKDKIYTTINPLFLSHIDKKIQMLFALLLPYGDLFFNTKIQRLDRTIQVSTLMKYLYHTLYFEFKDIIKYSQANHRVLKHFIKNGNIDNLLKDNSFQSSEAIHVINRFKKHEDLLKLYIEMFSLYDWKKSAYDLYKNFILKDDKYFHKIIKSNNNILGFAWEFSVMANGPVGFMCDKLSAIKTLTLHDNGFNVSLRYIKDDFSKEQLKEINTELIECQKRFFNELNIHL